MYVESIARENYDFKKSGSCTGDLKLTFLSPYYLSQFSFSVDAIDHLSRGTIARGLGLMNITAASRLILSFVSRNDSSRFGSEGT